MKLFIFSDEKSYGILHRISRCKIDLQGLYLKIKISLNFWNFLYSFWAPILGRQTKLFILNLIKKLYSKLNTNSLILMFFKFNNKNFTYIKPKLNEFY